MFCNELKSHSGGGLETAVIQGPKVEACTSLPINADAKALKKEKNPRDQSEQAGDPKGKTEADEHIEAKNNEKERDEDMSHERRGLAHPDSGSGLQCEDGICGASRVFLQRRRPTANDSGADPSSINKVVIHEQVFAAVSKTSRSSGKSIGKVTPLSSSMSQTGLLEARRRAWN